MVPDYTTAVGRGKLRVMDGPTTQVTNVVVMEGVTTALVLFCFVCVIVPTLIKNRHQFYAGFGSVCVIILLQTLRLMMYNSPGFQVVSGVLIGLAQLAGVILFFLAAGGLTLKQFGSDIGKTIEIIRRGEEEREIIIPRSEMPEHIAAAVEEKEARKQAEAERRIETLDLPAGAGWPSAGTGSPQQAPPKKSGEDKGAIPLE